MPQDCTKHRKLAAIMFTDMVGYSALMQRNEAIALELLEEHRRLLRSIFAKHQGSEIKTIGDGFLIEFSSTLAAVQCGIEIQETIAKRTSVNPPQGIFEVRIGIHVGDIVRRENDVIGDGVNIAARIVRLAGTGGVCISQQVFDQIEKRVPNSLKSMADDTQEYHGASGGLLGRIRWRTVRSTESPANREIFSN
jgi:class 3 adenylate cyclase